MGLPWRNRQLMWWLSGLRYLAWGMIVVRFDGSVRPLSSPTNACPGMTRAACAVVIMEDGSHPDHDEEGILAIGGRILEGFHQQSMESEYEGLLLALETLVQWQQGQLPPPPRDPCPHEDPPTSWEGLPSSSSRWLTGLTIQGDCRTVLQQVQGRAKPRRLRPYYDRALALLDQLVRGTTVTLEHIPRHENQLCDMVAGALVQEAQHRDCQQAWSDLGCGMEQGSDTDPNGLVPWTVPVTTEHGVRALDQKYTCCIPAGARVDWYRGLALRAAACEDHDSLVQMGSHMMSELCHRHKAHRSGALTPDMMESVVYQMVGWEAGGYRQKAEALRRRHKALWQRFEPEAAMLRDGLVSRGARKVTAVPWSRVEAAATAWKEPPPAWERLHQRLPVLFPPNFRPSGSLLWRQQQQ